MPELIDLGLVDIEPDGVLEVTGELEGHGQADIA